MLKKRSHNPLNNEKGMAVFEMIPIIIVIVLLVNFSLGFFGAIHTGILNSIASRNYTFETFRHRSNLVYFRNNDTSVAVSQFSEVGHRVHGTTSEESAAKTWYATARAIDFLDLKPSRTAAEAGSPSSHNTTSWDVQDGVRFQKDEGVNPIWIKTTYGICLNARCDGT
jgi:hypothetical protein